MDRLRELREQHGLSQAEVALIVGLSRPAYSNIEAGKRGCDIEVYKALAKFYQVSVDYICGASDRPAERLQNSSLDETLVNLLISLTPQEAQRVSDFVLGVKSSSDANSEKRNKVNRSSKE